MVESMIQLAASAASTDYVKFQAVIKSAASAASRKIKIQESRRARGRRPGMRTAGLGQLPWGLVPWILGSMEAALAADLITTQNIGTAGFGA